MRGRVGLWVVVLAVGACLAASSLAGASGRLGGREASTSLKRGGTLRLARLKDVDYLDPALAYYISSWPIEFATCAKLFNYPDQEGSAGAQVVPEVVRTFRITGHGRIYTFDLKKSFRFQNGRHVTAQSFAEAFNRDANPKMESPAQHYLHDIAGANAVMAGKARTISGVQVLGRYRLRIRLTRASGDILARLAMPFFCPLLPKTPIDPAGISNPPGSGPYYVADWIVNRRIVLKRNPYYRGERPANVDRITYTIKSPEECLLATRQNQIDVCFYFGVPRTAYAQLGQRYGVNTKGGRFFAKPTLATYYIAFNHDRRAFKGPGQIPLEKAINYAIDRPALVRTFGYRAGKATDQMLPRAVSGHEDHTYPLRGADLMQARKWLQRAKVKPRRLVLYWNNANTKAAHIIKSDLSPLGIDVVVKEFDASALFEKVGTRGEPFDLAFGSWVADYADGADFFVPLASGEQLGPTGNLNYSYFDDPRTNARIAAAERKRGVARRRAWAKLDHDLMRTNPPWAPYVNVRDLEFVSKSFGCYVYNPVFGIDFAAACKK